MLACGVARTRRVFEICFVIGFIGFIDISSAQAQTLPSPWSAQDIGSPEVSGRVSVSGSQFTVSAGGRDIWDQSDQFHFTYRQVTGDVDVIARVDSLAETDPWAKAGVMIRSSLTASAAHAFAMASAANGGGLQYRPADGGVSTHVGASFSAPRWVRLKRAGTSVTAYSSADGQTWSLIGTSTIALGSAAYVGLAATSHNVAAATTAVFSQPAVVPLTAPASFQSTDIGAPSIKGSMSYQQGTYTVKAGGADIAGASDQFHFVYQQVSGDVDVIARVQSLTNSNGWAKAGVMIRETLTAGSRHASAVSTYQYGYRFQRRADTGGLSDSTIGPGAGRPGWVRLVRSGSQIESFYSANGTSWTSMGVDAIPMADAVYVGLAVTSHRTTRATTAIFDNLRVTKSGTASNQSPLVALTAPAHGATFTAGTNVSVSAAASDGDGTISRVEFFAGSTLIGSDATAPYAVTWQVPSGTYSLTAAAVDNDGARTTSASVTISAGAATNPPPVVTLTAPANGASYIAPATIAVSATATDANGIARVEFYRGTTLLATDTSSPYGYSWTGVAAGTYAVRAVAYDNAGASGSSATANVTVTAATTGIPAPWTAADIGSPALAGSSTYSSGVFAVDAAGNDIWNTADQFRFIYQAVSGDVEIVARVDSLTVVDPFTNAGVMIRASLAAGSMHGYTSETGSYGVYFRRRLTTGGTTTSNQGAVVPAPIWVRLVRQGTTVTSYSSTTGTSWTLIGSQTIALGATAYVGLAVSSHNAATRTSARFSNVRVTTPSGNQPPTVSLTTPASGATYTAPASVAFAATASDPENSLARVEFYSGSTLLYTDTTAPYGYTWSSVPAGSYSVRAVAYDTSGASASSATRSVTVSGGTTSAPRAVVFQASTDHATLVSRYELRIFASGANVLTAVPLVTSDLGKPSPASNGEITVDRATVFSALAIGNYVAAVRAVGSGGTSTSTGVSFTR
jgi:regulation of enolase protein 1 (concanavalin A-like superfamily)